MVVLLAGNVIEYKEQIAILQNVKILDFQLVPKIKPMCEPTVLLAALIFELYLVP